MRYRPVYSNTGSSAAPLDDGLEVVSAASRADRYVTAVR